MGIEFSFDHEDKAELCLCKACFREMFERQPVWTFYEIYPDKELEYERKIEELIRKKFPVRKK